MAEKQIRTVRSFFRLNFRILLPFEKYENGQINSKKRKGKESFCKLKVIGNKRRTLFRTMSNIKMERFTKTVSGCKPLTIFAKRSVLQSFKYAYEKQNVCICTYFFHLRHSSKEYTFFINNTFISTARLKLAKYQEKATATFLRLNFCYLKIISFLHTLSSKNKTRYSKKILKKISWKWKMDHIDTT